MHMGGGVQALAGRHIGIKGAFITVFLSFFHSLSTYRSLSLVFFMCVVSVF